MNIIILKESPVPKTFSKNYYITRSGEKTLAHCEIS